MLRGLHKVCDKGQWDGALSRLATHSARSNAMEKGGWGGWTPLHLACKRHPPLNVVLALLDVAPESVSMEDNHLRHPIHHAAEWGSHVEVLAALYDSHPASVTSVDSDGRTPLHLSILGSNRDSQQRRETPALLEVELLLDGNGVAETLDHGGNLPLHCACDNIDNFSDVDVIKAIVNANRVALTTRNADGQTPLHLALLKCEENPPSLDLVKLLIGGAQNGEKSPVARMEDNEGKLPLHCACRNFASFEVLNELLVHCPEAAGTKCCDGTYPLDILEEMRDSICTADEMEEMNYKSDLLFAHYPNILPYRKDADRLRRLEDLIVFEAQHGGSLSLVAKNIWVWLCTFPESEDHDGLYSTTVKNIVTRVKETNIVRSLANIETTDGVAVRHVASMKCKAVLQPLFRFADRFEFMNNECGGQLVVPLHETESSLLVRLKDHDGVAVGAEPPVVAMRFMSDPGRFHRERAIYARLAPDDAPIPRGILPLLQSYDCDRVGWRDEEEGDGPFSRSMSETGAAGTSPYDLAKYRYALVFPVGDRTLEEMTRHEKSRVMSGAEKGNMDVKRVIAREMGEALMGVHKKNIVHGDLHTGSYLRVEKKGLMLTGMDGALVVGDDYIGGGNIKTSLLPPEMFVRLTPSQVKSYERYFKTVKDDAEIYKNMTKQLGQDEIDLLADKVDDYLSLLMGISSPDEKTANQAEFNDLWNRIARNAALWKTIRPRLATHNNEDCYYVVRCFRRRDTDATITGNSNKSKSTIVPLCGNVLPYEPFKAAISHDMWNFGLLLFQFFSGSTLFPTTFDGDLITDESYVTIARWNEGHAFDMINENNIEDPVLRDLLRQLLAADASKRLSSMEDVFSHPFFDEEALEKADMLRHQVIFAEDTKRKRESELARVKKEHDEWVKKRTKNLKFLSTDTTLKLTRSTSSQWRSLCGMANGSTALFREYLCPTGFIILPYELDLNGGMAKDKTLASHFAMLLGETLNITCLAGMVVQNSQLKLPSSELFSDYLKILDETAQNSSQKGMGDNANNTSLEPAAIVSICEWIILRTTNAEDVLGDILSYYIPSNTSSDDKSSSLAHINAKKLVRDFVSRFVDIDVCRDVVHKATVAQTAFAKLIENVVPDGTSTAKRIVHEKLGSLIDKDLAKTIANGKPCLEEGFMEIVRAFASDMIGACIQVCTDKVSQLFDIYCGRGYLYFLDEYTGRPVVDGSSIMVDKNELQDLFSAMRLGVKTACAENIIEGLRNVTGLHDVPVDQSWEEMARNLPGNWETVASTAEYTVFHEIVNGVAYEEGDSERDLERVEKYVLKMDERREYGGLKRLLAPDGRTTLWTLESAEEDIEKSVLKTLVEYAKQKETNALRDILRMFNMSDDKEDADTKNKLSTGKTLSDKNGSESFETQPSTDTDCDTLDNDPSVSSAVSHGTDVVHPKNTSRLLGGGIGGAGATNNNNNNLSSHISEASRSTHTNPASSSNQNSVVYPLTSEIQLENNGVVGGGFQGRKYVTVKHNHTRDTSWDMSTITMNAGEISNNSSQDDYNNDQPSPVAAGPDNGGGMMASAIGGPTGRTPVAANRRFFNGDGHGGMSNNNRGGILNDSHNMDHHSGGVGGVSGLGGGAGGGSWSQRFKQQQKQQMQQQQHNHYQDHDVSENGGSGGGGAGGYHGVGGFGHNNNNNAMKQPAGGVGGGIVSSRSTVFEKNTWSSKTSTAGKTIRYTRI